MVKAGGETLLSSRSRAGQPNLHPQILRESQFFSRPPGACGGRYRQLGDQELEADDLGLEFRHLQLFTRYWVLPEGLPAVVGGGSDAGLAERLIDVYPGVEVGAEVAEDRRRSGPVWVVFAWVAPWLSASCTIPIKTGPVFGGQASSSQ